VLIGTARMSEQGRQQAEGPPAAPRSSSLVTARGRRAGKGSR
jgi:hypothetical protein